MGRLGLTGIVLAGLIVVVAGVAGPTPSLRVVSSDLHLARSLQSDDPPATDSRVVAHTTLRPGDPGYNIIPASQFHPTELGPNSGRIFRGGKHSTPPDPSLLQAAPRSPLASSSPKIASTVANWGMTALNPGPTPPDSTGSIGPMHYVEMVNSRVAVYDRSLNPVGSPTPFTTFLGVGSTVGLCDPQIQWVPSAQRWLFVLLYCNAGASNQGIFIGWSKSSDPTNLTPTGWCAFFMGTATQLLDYPKLGHNSNYMIVGGNVYNNPTTATPTFAGSVLAWFSLPPNGTITTCSAPVPNQTSSALKNGDGATYTFTPVPVNTYTNATDGYIVSAYDPAGNSGPAGAKAKVAVWHLNSSGALIQDNDVVVNTYNTPTSAAQQGAPAGYTLDTLDARLTQAVGDPAAGFWTQHTVVDPFGRSEVDWYEFAVSGPSVVLVQQGSIRDAGGDWIFNGAISPRADGQGAAIVYNHSSLNTVTRIAAQIRYAATPLGTMAAGELMMGQGVGPVADNSCLPANGGPPCRWGDYAAATPDPVNTNMVWATNQVNVGSSGPGWYTQNFEIAPTPEAPTNVQATPDRSSAMVTWTPGAYDPGCATTSFKITPYFSGTSGAPITVTAPASSMTYPGLTPGTTYTFTVIATCTVGPSLESTRSNAVFIGTTQSTAPATAPPRDAVNQLPVAPPPPSGR